MSTASLPGTAEQKNSTKKALEPKVERDDAQKKKKKIAL